MATVESAKSAPARSSSLQLMLELEKQAQFGRLHMQKTPQAAPRGLQTTLRNESPVRPPLQLRRRESLSQHQKDAMLQAIRQSVVLPSLVITIPPNPSRRKSQAVLGGSQPTTTKADADPAQKSVKFLGLEDEEVSEVSSICQSPSWEFYRQNKKTVKEKARRQKKEKEQADRETKLARKKLAARLTKAPPADRQTQPKQLASADRSLSEPVVGNRGLLSSLGAENVAKHQQDEKDVSMERSSDGNAGVYEKTENTIRQGLPLNTSQTIPHPSAGRNGIDPRQRMQKSYSMAPDTDFSPRARETTFAQPDLRSPRQSCPPSASRTPMLRPDTASTHQRSRSATVLSRATDQVQSAARVFRRREKTKPPLAYYNSNSSVVDASLNEEEERGRSRESYVRHQRGQSAERALAGHFDEQLDSAANSITSMRSDSRQSRRLSLTKEAKHAALKIAASIKSVSTSREPRRSKEDGQRSVGTGSETTDYFSFLEQPYSPPGRGLLSPVGSLPASMKAKASPVVAEPSAASSNSFGKLRSSNEGTTGAPNRSAPASPDFSNVPELSKAQTQRANLPPSMGYSTTVMPSKAARLLGEPNLMAKRGPFAGHASSGSTASSAYEAVSIDTPASTPSSSRPGSGKAHAITVGQVASGLAEKLIVNDDEKTTRKSFEAAQLTEIVEPSAEPYHAKTSDEKLHNAGAALRQRRPSLAKSHSDPDLIDRIDPRVLAWVRPHASPTVPTSEELARPQSSPAKHYDGTAGFAQDTRSHVGSGPRGPVPSSAPRLRPSSTGVAPLPSPRGFTHATKTSRFPEPLSSYTLSADGPAPLQASASTPAQSSVAASHTSLQNPARESLVKLPPARGAGHAVQSFSSLMVEPGRGQHRAKMLVECCSCGFFHDMPSRVYECMVTPDAIVEDRQLGVSGAITTAVKCPWCAHSMSTRCCAGYAAVVYLKERLH